MAAAKENAFKSYISHRYDTHIFLIPSFKKAAES